jgi:hypothetical protein
MATDYQLRLKIHLRFLNTARKRFKKLGVGVSSACEQEIEKTISVGVSRLGHQRALENEGVLLVAEENILRILKDMYERAQVLGTFPVLDGKVFEDTKKRLSPMWPFF